MSDKRVAKLFEYCLSMAKEFESRMNRLRVFVPHSLSSGNANELILRDFLASHAPSRFCVGEGFICDPLEDKVSRQCDILVYRQDYHPLVYSDGPIKVIWPGAATLVTEVKTTLNQKTLYEALANIRAAKEMNPDITGVIFAFQTQSIKTTIRHLEDYPDSIDSHHALCGPTAIILLDKGAIIHRWSWSRNRDVEAGRSTDAQLYAVRIAKADHRANAITFYLLLFFAAVGEGTIYSAEMLNLLINLLEERMDKSPDDLSVGVQP